MTTRDETTSRTEVRIRGPLPLDVAGSLLNAVGTMYPGTRIASNAEGDALTLLIPDTDRPAAEGLDVGEALEVIRLDPTGLSAVTPPGIATAMAAMVDDLFAESPGAENYLEFTFAAPDHPHSTYVLICVKPGGETPHQLRLAADSELAAAEEEITRLKARIAELERA